MPELSFVQSNNVPQLYYVNCNIPGGDINNQLVYLLARASNPIKQQPLSLQDAWTKGGCFIFLGSHLNTTSDAENSFCNGAWNFLEDPSNQIVRFAWFADPLNVNLGLFNNSLSIISPDNKTFYLDKPRLFPFGNYQILMGKDCVVTLGADNESFIFTKPGDQPWGLSLQVGTSDALTDTTILTLPLCGPQSGFLQLPITLHNDAQTNHFDLLDIGLRLFYLDLQQGQQAPDSFFLTSQRFPIFDATAQSTLNVIINLDPLNPVDTAHTSFSFNSDVANPVKPIATNYRSNLGYKVMLTPQAEAKLVLATKPVASTPSSDDQYYLIPQGFFQVSLEDSSSNMPSNLMCGLSGVEYIKIDNSTPGFLNFVPGKPAYSPGFIPGKATSLPPNASTSLVDMAGNSLVTTSWVYPNNRNNGVSYYAQPDSAIMYNQQLSSPQSNPANTSLFYYELKAADLPANPTNLNDSFPWLPFAGVDSGSLEVALQFESQIISSVRRAVISVLNEVTNPSPENFDLAPDDVFSTTPQGLLGRFSQNKLDPVWKQLILAQDNAQNQISFQKLAKGSPLRAALQTNQLCLIITDPSKIQETFVGGSITIGSGETSWSFDTSLVSWNLHKTILILKFYDKPLQELVNDINTWALPANFNIDVADTRKQLAEIFQTAQNQYSANDASPETKKVYDYFVNQVMMSAQWQGIIALRVAVPLTDLPQELAGLAAGIDPAQFYAHHLGVEATPILSGTALKPQASSLFGLIDYNNQDYPPPNDSGYNFKVDTLRVLFYNSNVTSFSSVIEVTLDKLFGEITALVDSPSGRNNVILNGRYEVHNGQPVYTFAFNGDNVFSLPSSYILNSVEILKAQFITTVPANGFQQGDLVQSRFSFWGLLNYKKIDRFDLFSFGDEITVNDATHETKKGFLSFSNLGINMSFAWGKSDQHTFAFDPAQLAFNLEQSQPRSNSLYSHFPMTVSGFIFSEGDKTVGDYGYMPIRSPMVSKGLDKAWYGLTFDLELGSVGALAGNAGITVGLVCAWSPSSTGVNAFIGLKLPGSTGKNEISLQGVIKLVFGTVQFIVTGTEDTGLGYILKLKNIALKFFVLSIPPNGQTEILIFGDPKAQTSNKTLGWYAAYAKNPVPATPPPQNNQPPALPTA